MVRFLAKLIDLPGNALSALASGLSVYLTGGNPGESSEEERLWLVLLASNPDCIWFPLPDAHRRAHIDETPQRR